MDETELIITLQTLLEDTLSAPARTEAQEDDRPVPVVIIEDWDTSDFNFNNSAKSGEAYGYLDGQNEKSYEWYLNFSYETRVELLFRHHDEVDVSRMKETAKQQLQLVGENPQAFNDNLKNCTVGRSGNPRTTFVESNESELMLSAKFHADHTITRTADDMQNNPLNHDDDSILESVINEFTFDNSN